MGSKQKIPTTADGARKSGRAVFDNQGRASWEWQTATGVFETDVTSDQLQSLEASGLAVVESEQAEPGRVWTSVPRSGVSDASADTPHDRCRASTQSNSAQAPAPPHRRLTCIHRCRTILSRAG